MKTLNRIPIAVYFAIPVLYFFWTVFSQIPTLQHEVIGLIYWWNRPDIGFLNTLFDSAKMDSYPGRFRYIEYLAEAGYWKALFNGWLPRELYDYFAIFSHGFTGFLLYRIGKKQGLPPFAIFLILTLFILAVPNYMVTRLHFRKAKSIVTILFAVIAYSSIFHPIRRWNGVISSCWVLGFFSDPFFISIAPILLVGLAWDDPHRRKMLLNSLGLGILLSAIAWVSLNGFIGPYFSENAKLMVQNFQGKPATVLDWTAVPEFPRVLTELFTPSIPFNISFYFGLLVTLVLAIAMVQGKRENRPIGMLAATLAMAPIAAFLIRPLPERLAFSGYYGQPLLVIMILGLFQFHRNLSNSNSVLQRSFLLAVFIMICSNQASLPMVYSTWIQHQIIPRDAYQKVSNEYRQMRALHAELKKNQGPISFPAGPRSFRSSLGSNLYYMSPEPNSPTDLVLVLFPMLFQKELRSGRLVFTHSDT